MYVRCLLVTFLLLFLPRSDCVSCVKSIGGGFLALNACTSGLPPPRPPIRTRRSRPHSHPKPQSQSLRYYGGPQLFLIVGPMVYIKTYIYNLFY